MKKILLTMTVLLGAANLFAQRATDLKASLLTPAAGTVYMQGDTIKSSIEFKNLGTTNWIIGDTIGFQYNTGPDAYRFVIYRDVAPNDTLLLISPIQFIIQEDTNRTINFCVIAQIRNAQNVLTDANNNNNGECKSLTLKKKATTSINDVNAIAKSLTVYPNPANNEIAFNAEAFTNKAFDIQVFDMAGRLVMTRSYKSANNDQKIDISHLNSGLYQIRISQEGNRYIGKFLKQ